jgi:hypothetical protein
MKVHMLQVVLIVAVLSAVLISFALTGQFKKGFLRRLITKEGFKVVPLTKPLLRCPSGSVVFTNKKGDMDCCSTTLIDGVCPSILCTLSPVHDNLSSCVDVLKERLEKRSANYCPASKPHYFENSTFNGCSSVKPSQDGTLDNSVSKSDICFVYEKELENYSKKESCILQKLKENFKCPFPPETTSLAILQSEDKPAMIWCTSVTAEGIKQCGEDKTLLNYLDAAFPSWRNTFSLEQKSLFCSLHERAKLEEKDITSFDFP